MRRFVLLVEDDSAVRELVEFILQSDGWEVLTAETAEEGIQHFVEHHSLIRLVVTDIVMPGYNGYWLAQKIRAAAPHIPIIGMSGYADVETAKVERQVYFQQFLSKPFPPAELLTVVRSVCSSQAPKPLLNAHVS